MLSPNVSLTGTTTSNGSDSEHNRHHQQQHQHTTTNNSNRRGSTSNGGNQVTSTAAVGAGTSRRKPSLNYHHQMQLVNGVSAASSDNASGSGLSCSDDSPSRFSPHTNELYHNHHHQAKLSMQAIDRYDDSLGCCLPPPSPAPNSDRFIVGNLAVTTPGTSAATVSAGNVIGGGGGLHMHAAQYNTINYECKTSATVSIAQQSQPHMQSLILSSSTSTSSLSTNSSSPSCSNGCTQMPVMSTSTTVAPLNFSHKYVATMQQSTISPNSRYRTSSERFRELPSSKSVVENSVGGGTGLGHAPPSLPNSPFFAATHFLTQSSPLVSSDTYASYLSSTVHTPVQRYVPTPPPPNELFADISIATTVTPVTSQNTTSTSSVSKCSGDPTTLHGTSQQMNTLPYRLRMKCCNGMEQTSGLQINQQSLPTNHPLEHRTLSTSDYFSTSPRTRATYNMTNSNTSKFSGASSSLNCNNHDPSVMMLATNDSLIDVKYNNKYSGATSSCISAYSSTSSLVSSTSSPVTVGSGSSSFCGSSNPRQTTTLGTRPTACLLNDFVPLTPSIEYMNSIVSTSANSTNTGSTSVGRVLTPVLMETANGSTNTSTNATNSSTSTSAATCLHCNTVRRTTGVHQTTQTTGPISPIPLPQLPSSIDHCPSSSSLIHEETTSTLTPITTAHTHQQTQSLLLQKLEAIEQQQHDASTILNNQEQMYIQQKITAPLYQLQSCGGMASTTAGCNKPQQKLPPQQKVDSNRQFPLQNASLPQIQAQQLPLEQRYSRKKRLNQYLRKKVARFFGVESVTEAEECAIWHGRQRRLALRRFGALKSEREMHGEMNNGYTYNVETGTNHLNRSGGGNGCNNPHYHYPSERPDVLPAQAADEDDNVYANSRNSANGSIADGRSRHNFLNAGFQLGDHVARKATVATLIMSSIMYIVHTINNQQPRYYRQWSRSFAPAHVNFIIGVDHTNEICESLSVLQEEEMFFDTPVSEQVITGTNCNAAYVSPTNGVGGTPNLRSNTNGTSLGSAKLIDHQRQIYIGERVHGWRTSAIIANSSDQSATTISVQQQALGGCQQQQQPLPLRSNHQQAPPYIGTGSRGNRISSQLLDGVLENSRRPLAHRIKLFSIHDLDDRTDHRPFFTYWINTVQILVLFLSLVCYGIGPIGIGVEQKTGQVLVTSLSLQTVQHTEQRNVWIGPRNNDLVHMGAKFATCMRRDVKILDVLLKTRRQERETACCIRNDDSGCVQSSQADCSVRGLFPTKSISTWKKWSPGESGPGGRISGSVCGLDPKYCDAPASIAPYEWPDDITKWPICRKTNSFSQRFRYKDHTAEHMVCEVIGHPCCTGVYGECRITTREYCDFVNGYFHEEASLCSQISCLNNVCGMFPFLSIEVPDQFYRLFTSLCLHAGILHLFITIAFQHVFLADLERLIGPIRTAIVYIGSGLAGNLTSAVLVPYKPEVGPLASLSGVLASLVILLILIHWKQLRKPHVALFKLIMFGAILFGIGTLPWQLNFAGLVAGIFCGIFLTVALVPFVSITKYGRKAKINFIWSCIIFHLLIYTVMMVIFYIFPTEFTNLNFGEILSNSLNQNVVENSANIASNDFMSSSSIDIHSKNRHNSAIQQQFHYHHHSDDIITNSGSKISHLLQSPASAATQHQQTTPFYHRPFHNNMHNGYINTKNSTSKNIKSKTKNNIQYEVNATTYYMNTAKKYFNNSKNNNNDYKTSINNNNKNCYNMDNDSIRSSSSTSMKNNLRHLNIFKNSNTSNYYNNTILQMHQMLQSNSNDVHINENTIRKHQNSEQNQQQHLLPGIVSINENEAAYLIEADTDGQEKPSVVAATTLSTSSSSEIAAVKLDHVATNDSNNNNNITFNNNTNIKK